MTFHIGTHKYVHVPGQQHDDVSRYVSNDPTWQPNANNNNDNAIELLRMSQWLSMKWFTTE